MENNSKINDGGAAFPRPQVGDGLDTIEGQSGMSLRDYFAAKAMQGEMAGNPSEDYLTCQRIEGIAQQSYAIADAMLKARGL